MIGCTKINETGRPLPHHRSNLTLPPETEEVLIVAAITAVAATLRVKHRGQHIFFHHRLLIDIIDDFYEKVKLPL